MKSRVLYIFIIIAVIASLFVPAAARQVTAKKDVEAFVKYLTVNKDTLKYESFGSFEHDKLVEVRIYCNEEAKNKIVKNLNDYSYLNYNYKNHTIPTGVLYIVFGRSAKKGPGDSSNPVKVKCPRRVPVKVDTVKKESINEFKFFEGLLTDGGKTSIVSPVDGTVKNVLFNPGDRINQGDRILNLDSTETDKKISDTEKSLQDWTKRLKRRRGWKVRSPKAEKQAERKIEEFTKLIAELKKQKENSALSSEISGQLISVAQAGDVIAKGAEIASVRDNSSMRMEISSEEITLFEGMESIKVNIEGKGEYSAKVKREGGRIFIIISNDDFGLTSSDKASFKILSHVYRDVPVLDKNLILKDQKGEFIYSPVKKRAKKLYIKTGVFENGKVMVVSGLQSGTPVITTLESCLKEGKKIKVTEGKIPPEKIIKKSRKEKKKKKKEVKKEVVKKPVKYIEKPVPESEQIKTSRTKEGEWGEFDNCPSVVKVRVRKVETGSMYGSEVYSSKIESAAMVNVLSETSGKLAAVYFSAGQRVQKGDLLMEFDIADIEGKKSEKQKQLEQWKKVLSDTEAWEERNEQLENEIKDKIRKISLELASLHRSEIDPKVYSPVSGTLASIASSGAEVKEGDLIALITDNSRVRIPVELKSSSGDLTGFKIEVTFPGISGKFAGTFSSLKGKQYVFVGNTYNNLKNGMKANISIFRKYENRVIISKSEMLRDSGGIFVYLVKKDRAVKKYVKALSFGKTKVAIESGVKSGEEIVITNLDCVDNNKRIKVMVIDPATGKLVKRGKKTKKEIKREKVAKKKFAVGLGGAYMMISDQIFKDVYGTGNIAPMFTLSFRVSKNIDLFFNTMYLPKSGSTLSVEKVDLTYYEFNFGVRYLFGRSEKMLPFLGLAMNSLAVKEKSDEINLNTAYKTSTGGTVTGGVFFEITPGLDFLLDIRYDLNKMKAGEGLEDIDFSGLRMLIGIIFRF